MTVLYVAIGGALGSVARYLMQNLIGHYVPGDFPYGTLVVNVTGSCLMGLLIGWLARAMPQPEPAIRLFLAVGVLGGYTTFSSFSLDAITLLEEGNLAAMGLYVFASVLCSLAGLLVGLYVVRAIQ